MPMPLGKSRLVGCIAIGMLVAPTVPVLANDAAAGCELHIWPAERLEGLAFRVGHITGRSTSGDIENAMDDLLSPATQVQALRDADLPGRLGLDPNTTIVEHLEPLDRKTVNRIKSRRAASTSNCYSELIIMEHKLLEDIVWGDRFQTAFLFRRFDDRGEPVLSFRKTGGTKLKILTLSENERPADSPALVRQAIKANFLEYAKMARPHLHTGSQKTD